VIASTGAIARMPAAGSRGNGSQPRIRVLYVARAPFVSGAERALLSTLRHLDRSRVQPALVLGHRTEMVRLAEAMGVPTIVTALPRRTKLGVLGWWRSLGQMNRLLRDFDPHVVHANDVPSCQAMSVAAAERPFRGVGRVLHVRWGIKADEAAWWARAGVESVLCISQWVRDELGNAAGTTLANAAIEVVPDAVDWPATDADVPLKITPASGEPAIGFAGQVTEVKGLDLVIEALGRMPRDQRPKLLIAGKDTQSGGAYGRQLEALAKRHDVADRIEWLGFLSDVGQMYKRVRAVVCPSRVEPLGLVPLEAARYGVPAMANRLGGFTETIEPGVTGWLVEPTVDAWAAALPGVLDEAVTNRLGQAAHERTRRLFSPMVYQQRLMSVYEKVQNAKCKMQN
jgi:glycosyltransferase involved in cell wall biosynthesis